MCGQVGYKARTGPIEPATLDKVDGACMGCFRASRRIVAGLAEPNRTPYRSNKTGEHRS